MGYEHYSPTTTTSERREPAFAWRQSSESLPRIHEDVLCRPWQQQQQQQAEAYVPGLGAREARLN